MFKRRDNVGITRGRVQRLFQLLHRSSHKDFTTKTEEKNMEKNYKQNMKQVYNVKHTIT